jgi:hypothetical protein
VSRRSELLACLVLAALVVVARGVVFMAPGVRMDADQAVTGLMALHIADGRAFPLYYYGQHYLLALEAYLAAPLMWVLGPTEVALKLPVLAMNVATALLLVWHGARAGVRPWLALVAALPVVLPPIVVGTRLMEAMGGNVETPFYALLLWTVRGRPWAFGAVTALALAHRELSLYPLAALIGLEVMRGAWRSRAVIERWAIAALLVAAVQTALVAVRPFAAMFGPGTMARPVDVELTSASLLRGHMCLGLDRWGARGTQIASEHLPIMAGGLPGPLQIVGVSTGMGQGNPGAFPWVVALVAAGLVAGFSARRTPAAAERPGGGDAVPEAWLPWFLLASGAISTLVYGFVSCAQITPNTLRYDLLIVCVPAGAVLAGLRHHRPAVRAGLVTAMLVWIAPQADDYRALGAEVASGRWPDHRGRAVAMLEARGLTALWGDFRLAYVLTFRAAERITVASTDSQRIDVYADRARAAQAPSVQTGACAAGEQIVPGVWLCPP